MAEPTARTGSFEIHTEARGPHWVGWVTHEGNDQPDRGVVFVAANQADAEARARAWAAQSTD